ncbi:hypothetical protein SN15_03965 [Stenotrophomonas maltophilia]|nr:hypothetical protein SN15_03965 [Stenotrophomonas maltophilia]
MHGRFLAMMHAQWPVQRCRQLWLPAQAASHVGEGAGRVGTLQQDAGSAVAGEQGIQRLFTGEVACACVKG